MSINLDEFTLPSIFLASVVLVLASCEIGRRLGTRSHKTVGQDVLTLESAILGLLALMIGFTFAMALSRFEDRRDAVLDEANTIGTAALRARLLPPQHGNEILGLLQSYTLMRVEITRGEATRAAVNLAIARSAELQEKLWRNAMAVAEEDRSLVPTALFIQSLNSVIDSHTKRLSALRNRVPNAVLLSLYTVAAAACAFAGFVSGIGKRPSRFPIYATGILIAGVMLLVIDLDRPGSGFIRVGQEPMIDAARSIQGYLTSDR